MALARWNKRPWAVLRPWLGLSLLIAVLLLVAVYVVATLTTPDSSRYIIPGVNSDADLSDYLHVLYRNSLVLALHAMACVAGFIAGSALPLSASHRSGIDRWVHEKAGPFAIAFVLCATAFSLCHPGLPDRLRSLHDRRPVRHRPGAAPAHPAPPRHTRAGGALPPARRMDHREPA